MQNIRKNRSFLDLLIKTGPKQRKALLSTSTPEQRLVIGEICYNILQGGSGISKHHKTTLSQYSDIIRRLANRDIKDSRRRYWLMRNNEAVAAIIGTVFKTIFRHGQ